MASITKTVDQMSIPGEKKEFSPFPDFDLKKIEKSAKTDASMGSAINNDNPPSIIHDLDDQFSKYQRILKHEAQDHFTNSQKHITECEHSYDLKMIKNHLLGIEKNSSNLNLNHEEKILDNHHQNFIREKNNFIRFRQEHSLSMLPINADPDEIRFQKFFLIALFVIEFFINAFMLQSGGTQNLPQSLAVSIGQTFWNILGSYLIGKHLIGAMIFSKTLAKKIGIALFTLLHFYTILATNANMGFYRQSLIKAASNESRYNINTEKFTEVIHLDFWNYFNTLDVTSLIAVLIGIVFAFLAYIDGYKSDDPYPGYGEVYRKMINHKKTLQKHSNELNNRWTKHLKVFHNEYVKLSQYGVNAITRWSHEINTIEQVRDDYLEIIKRLEDRFQKSVKAYTSAFNKFSEKNNLKLDKLTLLDKSQFDMNKEFNDVKNFFMNDDTRLKKAKKMREDFQKGLDLLHKELESRNLKMAEQIKKLSSKHDVSFS